MSEINYLDMSDEEIANLSAPLPATAAAPQGGGDPTEVVTDPADDANADPVVTDGQDDAGDGDGEGANNGNPAGEGDGTVVVDDPSELDAEGNPIAKPAADPVTTDEVDYKAAYEALIGTPIKAAGKEITLKNVDEVKRLVQMGADYHRQNERMKPMRRVEAMLRNNNLLDEDQVGFMIDLMQKKPEAIAKLMAETEISPLSLDADLAATYKPSDHRVTDSQLNLDDAITTLESSDHGKAILDDVGAKWDQQSRIMAATNPEVLSALADHKEAGYYDQIVAEVERQRTFGKLSGVPFLTAYKQVGDLMNEHGVFAQGATQELVPPAKPTQSLTTKPVAVRPAQPANSQVQNPRAAQAAAPRGAAKPAPVDVNYLDMPDEDFAKLRRQ